MGWVGATALGWTWMAAPLLQWTTSLFGVETTIPALDPNAMYPVILAILGISASRTVEKLNGAATSMGGVILKPSPTSTAPATPTEKTETKKQFNKMIFEWIDGLGKVEICKTCNEKNDKKNFLKNFDLNWTDDENIFTKNVIEKFHFSDSIKLAIKQIEDKF